MTAVTMDDVRDLVQPRPLPAYDGFPWWRALLVKSSGEMKAAKWLHRVQIFPYAPTFTRHVHWRGKIHHARQHAVIVGMIFVPERYLDSVSVEAWRAVSELAGIYGEMRGTAGEMARISKSDIEEVRRMEADLNLPQEAIGVEFKVGQEVRFKDGSLWQGWNGGTVFDIVDVCRIGVEIPKLFGCGAPVYVPASEIEAM